MSSWPSHRYVNSTRVPPRLSRVMLAVIYRRQIDARASELSRVTFTLASPSGVAESAIVRLNVAPCGIDDTIWWHGRRPRRPVGHPLMTRTLDTRPIACQLGARKVSLTS